MQTDGQLSTRPLEGEPPASHPAVDAVFLD